MVGGKNTLSGYSSFYTADAMSMKVPKSYQQPMADIKSEKARSENMAAIHNKNTKPELVLRKALWGKGYRYRKNYNLLPGKPDIVLTK